MLEVTGVKKAFGDNPVLKGVDLRVSQGDVTAIIGPSGSGKTTLLRCMNFLERADEGSMCFDGERIDLHTIGKRDVARLRRKTAFVFQNYNLFANKTALQNVTEGLIVARKVPKAEAIERGRQVLEKVGLSDRRDYYPSQLSGGQQQRVAIARALIAKPDIIFADEPTGNLDTKSSSEVMEMLCNLRAKMNKTLVVITHDPGIAERAERRFTIIDGVLSEVTVR